MDFVRRSVRIRSSIVATSMLALSPGGWATPYAPPPIATSAQPADAGALDIGDAALRDAARASVRATHDATAVPRSDPGSLPGTAWLPACHTLELAATAVAVQVACARSSGSCGTVDTPAPNVSYAMRPVPRWVPPADCQPKTVKLW